MSFHSHPNKTRFDVKGCAPGLTFKKRYKSTWKMAMVYESRVKGPVHTSNNLIISNKETTCKYSAFLAVKLISSWRGKEKLRVVKLNRKTRLGATETLLTSTLVKYFCGVDYKCPEWLILTSKCDPGGVRTAIALHCGNKISNMAAEGS